MWSVLVGAVFLILFRDSSPPLSRPVIVSDIRAVSPRSLALCQLAFGVLSLSALEIVLSSSRDFSSRLFLVEKVATACFPGIGLSTFSVRHSACRHCASIYPREGFSSVRSPECCVSSVPALPGSRTLLMAPVSSGSWPVRSPVLLAC